MTTAGDLEASSLFRLLNPNDTQEIDITQMNTLLQRLDSLGSEKESEPKAEASPQQEQVQAPVIKEKSLEIQPVVYERSSGVRRSLMANSPLRQASPLSISMEKPVNMKERIMKKIGRNFRVSRKSMPPEIITQSLQAIQLSFERKFEPPQRSQTLPFEIKSFPNNKTTMNFTEFNAVCEDALLKEPLRDDVLLKCFSVFDSKQQGVIDTKMIKEVFGLFNEEVTEEEVENLMNFLGCKNNTMTFNELKTFFKNNL